MGWVSWEPLSSITSCFTGSLEACWRPEVTWRARVSAWHIVGPQSVTVTLILCGGLVASQLASSFMAPGSHLGSPASAGDSLAWISRLSSTEELVT